MIIVRPRLGFIYRRFPRTTRLVGIFVHAAVLMLGGSCTYARVPLGFQRAEWLHLTRNRNDRTGHFFQGREILIRGRLVYDCPRGALGAAAARRRAQVSQPRVRDTASRQRARRAPASSAEMAGS